MAIVAWLMLLALALVWSASFFFVEVLLPTTATSTIVFNRVLLAAIAMTMLAYWQGKRLPTNRRSIGLLMLMGLTNAVLPYCAIVWGQQFITGGLAAILNSNTAFAGIILSGIFFVDEKMSWRKLLGVCLGIGGVVVTIGVNELTQLSATSLGQYAIIFASLCYAVSTVVTRKWITGVDHTMSVVIMFWGATLWMGGILWAIGGTPFFTPSPTNIACIFGIAVLSTSFAYLLYFALIEKAGAGSTVMVTILIPPLTIALNGLALQEPVTLQQLLGFGLIAVGLVLAVRGLDPVPSKQSD